MEITLEKYAYIAELEKVLERFYQAEKIKEDHEDARVPFYRSLLI